MSYFDWPIRKKRLKLWRLPLNRRFYSKMKCPLALLYRWEGEDSGQNIWDQSNVLLGQPFGYTSGTLGTHWALDGDPLRTWRNILGTKEKWKKSSTHPRHPKLKRKKNPGTLNACFSLPIGHMYFWFSKLFGHHIWPQLMAGAEIKQGRKTKNKSAPTHECCSFFLFEGQGIFFPYLFPMCSYHVPKWFPSSKCPHIKFPNCSQMRSRGCSQ